MWTSQWIGSFMNIFIYLLMGFIQGRWYLFKWSMNHKAKSDNILQNVKRMHKQMLSIVSMFSKPYFKLLQFPIDNGVKRW